MSEALPASLFPGALPGSGPAAQAAGLPDPRAGDVRSGDSFQAQFARLRAATSADGPVPVPLVLEALAADAVARATTTPLSGLPAGPPAAGAGSPGALGAGNGATTGAAGTADLFASGGNDLPVGGNGLPSGGSVLPPLTASATARNGVLTLNSGALPGQSAGAGGPEGATVGGPEAAVASAQALAGRGSVNPTVGALPGAGAQSQTSATAAALADTGGDAAADAAARQSAPGIAAQLVAAVEGRARAQAPVQPAASTTAAETNDGRTLADPVLAPREFELTVRAGERAEAAFLRNGRFEPGADLPRFAAVAGDQGALSLQSTGRPGELLNGIQALAREASGTQGSDWLTHLRTPVATGDADWSAGLGKRLLMMADRGIDVARLRLHPAHLGPLEIQVNVDDERAQVWFGAQNATTREALESALPRLRELFAQQGLLLERADVGSGTERDARPGAVPAEEGSLDAPAVLPVEADLSMAVPRGGGSLRALDIYV